MSNEDDSNGISRDPLDGLDVIVVKGEEHVIGRLKTLSFKLLGSNEYLIDDVDQTLDKEEEAKPVQVDATIFVDSTTGADDNTNKSDNAPDVMSAAN